MVGTITEENKLETKWDIARRYINDKRWMQLVAKFVRQRRIQLLER